MKRAFVMGLVVLRMAGLVESDTANINGKGFCIRCPEQSSFFN